MGKILNFNGEGKISDCVHKGCIYVVEMETEQGKTNFCTRYPPVVQMVPVQTSLGLQGIGVQSFFPPIPLVTCGEFIPQMVEIPK